MFPGNEERFGRFSRAFFQKFRPCVFPPIWHLNSGQLMRALGKQMAGDSPSLSRLAVMSFQKIDRRRAGSERQARNPIPVKDRIKPISKSMIKPVYLYAILADNDAMKIGIAENIQTRILALQSASPCKLKISSLWFFETKIEAAKAERNAHIFFRKNHLHGEWFNIAEKQISDFISLSCQECKYVDPASINPRPLADRPWIKR